MGIIRQRLYVEIEHQLRKDVEQEASQEGRSLTFVVEEALREHVARKRGEVLEQAALPLIREIVATEVKRSIAQLRLDLQEDRAAQIGDLVRRSNDRLVSLLIRTLRSSGIAQRMLFSWIAKREGADYAMKAYEAAKEQTGQDLARKAGPNGETS